MNLSKLVDLDDVTLDMDATHENGEKAKEVFCNYWDTTKTGLEMVKTMVKNPIVKAIVSIVIAVGDGISKKLCI